jgi:hypothetical protein
LWQRQGSYTRKSRAWTLPITLGFLMEMWSEFRPSALSYVNHFLGPTTRALSSILWAVGLRNLNR